MADTLPDFKKPYQPPQPFEYEQPDLPSSTSSAAEEAFEERKEASTKKQNEEKRGQENSDQIPPEQQPDIAAQMSAKKQGDKQKAPAAEETALKAAAAAATAIPVAGWFLKAIAFFIRGLKFVMGEQIASFIAIWILFTFLALPVIFIPIVGLIIIFVIPPSIALIATPILWPKIKPFIDQAGKIIPTKK